MRHPTEGLLRRLLDEPAGVPDADRQHVLDCPQCLDALASVQQDAALVGAALTTRHAGLGSPRATDITNLPSIPMGSSQ